MTEASPTLPETIARALASRLEDLNVAAPGIVVSYDEAHQTAEVQIALHRPVLDTDGGILTEEIPPIPNVPVLWPRTSSFSITAKLSPGDTVLLIFNSRSPTPWRRTGAAATPEDLRIHGIGYPVAIPGYLPDTTTKPDTDESIGVPGGLRIHFTPSAVQVGTGAATLPTGAGVDAELTKVQAAIVALGGSYARAPVAVSSNLKAD